MKTLRFATLALAAGLVLPAIAQAQAPLPSLTQVYTFAFEGVVNPATSPYGPYRAHETAPVVGSPFNLFCIDYDHAASSAFTGRVVTFADVIANNGGAGTAASAMLGAPLTAQKLRTAAYLTTRFAVSPTSQWESIHKEIWSMFSSSPDVSAFAAQAALDQANPLIGGNTAYDAYDMIIDNNAFLNGCTTACTQTFIVPDDNLGIRVVPEPSTYALMGFGLVAVGVISRRRRNNA